MRVNKFVFAGVIALAGIVLWSSVATAARISDIRNTKHNFSDTVTPNIDGQGDTRTVKATSESEICVFCHTPHGADLAEGPLWNKALPNPGTYTTYTSTSIDSDVGAFDVNGASKLCLSCHDGTIAIGSVRNVRTQSTTISMQGTSGGNMPDGPGANTGFTRNLGQDLSNDHPISLTYNSNMVNDDTEMRSPTQNPIRVRGVGTRPGIQNIHLQAQGTPNNNNGQVQCISCHDPHIRDTTQDNIKFLRFNRLQTADPDNSDTFLPNTDIICLACHVKDGYEVSAHAQPHVADEVYTNAAADAREFPRGTEVWESSCLACHDTHTVQGSRRLVREGVDGGTTTLSGYQIKSGNGGSAIEEGCYACHSPNRNTLQGQGGGTFEVPNVFSDFQLTYRMPITTSEQAANQEMHNIGTSHPNTSDTGGGADFIEDPNLLGLNNLNNRHAECTDCHNPHRVTKRRYVTQTNAGTAADAEGTHSHTQPHTNIASGVLRGMWGVEPQYGSESFHDDPTGFTVKRGMPTSTSTNPPPSESYLTREYQLCFKCHSNHAHPGGYNGPPTLGVATPPGTNGMSRYTNIAREYNSPTNHQGEGQNLGQEGGAGAAWDTNNHRAWHPVVRETGRDAAGTRNADENLWRPPFQATGSQTMYCTDCHGTDTANGTVVPGGSQPNGPVWGPHGSTNVFLLKGPWSGARSNGTGELEGSPNAESHLCFKCHEFNQYADPTNTAPLNSGFALVAGGMGGMMGGGMMGGGGGNGCMDGGMMCMGGMGGGGMGDTMGMNNLHVFHANVVTNFRCNMCHVAVPHGWKNKNFLVNLNDVGPEGGNAGQVRNNTTTPYVNGPYYNRAVLKLVNFQASGNWDAPDCGSVGNPGNGATGVNWMAGSSEACNNPP